MTAVTALAFAVSVVLGAEILAALRRHRERRAAREEAAWLSAFDVDLGDGPTEPAARIFTVDSAGVATVVYVYSPA